MPDIEHERRHLEETKRQIAAMEIRVAEQIARIQRMEEAGYPTTLAEQTLRALQGSLAALSGTRNVIEQVLSAAKGPG